MTDTEHQPTYTRYKRGTATYGNIHGAAGMQYGTKVRCTCGWECRANLAPTNGGRKRMKDAYVRHLLEVGA